MLRNRICWGLFFFFNSNTRHTNEISPSYIWTQCPDGDDDDDGENEVSSIRVSGQAKPFGKLCCFYPPGNRISKGLIGGIPLTQRGDGTVWIQPFHRYPNLTLCKREHTHKNRNRLSTHQPMWGLCSVWLPGGAQTISQVGVYGSGQYLFYRASSVTFLLSETALQWKPMKLRAGKCWVIFHYLSGNTV